MVPNAGLSARLAGVVWTLSTRPSSSLRAKALYPGVEGDLSGIRGGAERHIRRLWRLPFRPVLRGGAALATSVASMIAAAASFSVSP